MTLPSEDPVGTVRLAPGQDPDVGGPTWEGGSMRVIKLADGWYGLESPGLFVGGNPSADVLLGSWTVQKPSGWAAAMGVDNS
jgi:hypothetical protein